MFMLLPDGSTIEGTVRAGTVKLEVCPDLGRSGRVILTTEEFLRFAQQVAEMAKNLESTHGPA